MSDNFGKRLAKEATKGIILQKFIEVSEDPVEKSVENTWNSEISNAFEKLKVKESDCEGKIEDWLELAPEERKTL